MHEGFRKIIHIDMDAFYASVEQRDHPELRGKPVAVGGSRLRGVVAAASYEARAYGVRSAMPSSTAANLCPGLIFVPPRFSLYNEVSQQIRSIFREYTDLIEPLALDEAYLDVTENKKGIPFAMDIAEEIRCKIKDQLQLTASAGVSYNKFLAKIASDFNKPNGMYVVTPGIAEKFIEQLPIEKFFGVGKVTAKKMHDKGIFSGLDLKQHTRSALVRWFGKAGNYYYHIARGTDNRPVNPDRVRKSLGAERTYDLDLTHKEAMYVKLLDVADILIKRIENHGPSGKTLTLKIKFGDFRQVTRSHSLPSNYSPDQIREESIKLLDSIPDVEQGIRLIGLQLSNFEEEPDDQDVFLGQMELQFKRKPEDQSE